MQTNGLPTPRLRPPLGEYLRDARLSQADLVRALRARGNSIHHSEISRMNTGARDIPVAVAERIAEILVEYGIKVTAQKLIQKQEKYMRSLAGKAA